MENNHGNQNEQNVTQRGGEDIAIIYPFQPHLRSWKRPLYFSIFLKELLRNLAFKAYKVRAL